MSHHTFSRNPWTCHISCPREVSTWRHFLLATKVVVPVWRHFRLKGRLITWTDVLRMARCCRFAGVVSAVVFFSALWQFPDFYGPGSFRAQVWLHAWGVNGDKVVSIDQAIGRARHVALLDGHLLFEATMQNKWISILLLKPDFVDAVERFSIVWASFVVGMNSLYLSLKYAFASWDRDIANNDVLQTSPLSKDEHCVLLQADWLSSHRNKARRQGVINA